MESPPDLEKSNPLTPDSLAAEGAGGADQAIAARLGRYGTAKTRNREMAAYLATQGDDALASRMYRCASVLRFREWLAHGGKTTLHSGHFCQVALMCPVCAIRRGARMLRRYVERASFIARTHDLYLVTLTVKNGPDLLERYQHLTGSLKRLRDRSKKGYGAMAASDGALWSTEFTRSGKGWHPHVHMVWALPRGSDPVRWGQGSQLAHDWLAITGDSSIVHSTRIQADDEPALISAFCEVLKYSLKFSTLTLEDNLHAYRTLKGKRLIRSAGIWWGLELPEDARLSDDPLDGPYIEHMYRFMRGQDYVLQDVFYGVHPAPLSRDTAASTLPPEVTT